MSAVSVLRPNDGHVNAGFDSDPIKIVMRQSENPAAADVITYGAQFVAAIRAVQKSSVDSCIALYNCHKAYQLLGADADEWEAFAQDNFWQLGISSENLEKAIRAGELALKKMSEHPAMGSLFQKLSKATLFSLAETDYVDEQLALIEHTGSASVELTRKRELYLAQRAPEMAGIDTISQIQSDLERAKKRCSAYEEQNADINERLLDSEKEIENLRQALQEKPSMPKDVTDLEAYKVKLKEENDALIEENERAIEEKKKTIAQREAFVEQQQKKVTDLERKTREQTQVLNNLTELKTAVNAMVVKYTIAFIKSLTDADASTKPTLGEISANLHILADQLNPIRIPSTPTQP